MNENVIEKLKSIDLNNLTEEERLSVVEALRTIDLNSLEKELKEKAEWIMGLSLEEGQKMEPIEIGGSTESIQDENVNPEVESTPVEPQVEVTNEEVLSPSTEGIIEPTVEEASNSVSIEPDNSINPEPVIDSTGVGEMITENVGLEPVSEVSSMASVEASLDSAEPITITSTNPVNPDEVQSYATPVVETNTEVVEPVTNEVSKKKSSPVVIVILLIVIAVLGVVFFLIYNGTIDVSKIFGGSKNTVENNNNTSTDNDNQNSETPIDNEETNPESNNETDVVVPSEYYELNNLVNTKNSLFDYELKLVFEAEFNSMGVEMKVSNSTTATEMANVRLRFYDQNKNLMGTYQWRDSKEVNESSSFAVKVGMSASYSLSLSEDKLDSGKSFKDVVYYSVHELEFN